MRFTLYRRRYAIDPTVEMLLNVKEPGSIKRRGLGSKLGLQLRYTLKTDDKLPVGGPSRVYICSATVRFSGIL